MITAPDFREKQILFLDAYALGRTTISFRNENILVTRDGKTHDKVPLRRLLAIMLYGDMTLSSRLIQRCMRNGASIFLLNRSLRTYATIGAYAEGNYLLRQRQYALDENRALAIAKNIVENKLTNQLALLRGAHVRTVGTSTRAQYRKDMRAKIRAADNIASLRGIEGTNSKDFFRAYFRDIGWVRRIPRGKYDHNNILLDIGYSHLFNFVDSVLRLYGFDTYKGIYHQLYFQRKSLSCDIMEPFRCVIDRTLLKMHSLNQFNAKDFRVSKGRYYLQYQNATKYTRIFLKEILRYKNDIHTFVRGHYYYILNEEGALPRFTIR